MMIIRCKMAGGGSALSPGKRSGARRRCGSAMVLPEPDEGRRAVSRRRALAAEGHASLSSGRRAAAVALLLAILFALCPGEAKEPPAGRSGGAFGALAEGGDPNPPQAEEAGTSGLPFMGVYLVGPSAPPAQGETEVGSGADATAEPAGEAAAVTPEGEAALRQRLRERTGRDALEFFCADYDGNGTLEAFALVGKRIEWGCDGDLWFVTAGGAEALQEGRAYATLEMLGNPPTMIFHAEEYYGGSGSTSYTWRVDGDHPAEADAQVSGDLEWAGGNDYYGYPSAFDMEDDGTGHTWKRYYFYMDDGELREYGGIYITLDELLEFDGAAELIDARLADGYSVGSIVYRANGVINVNLDRGSRNVNLSLRYDATSVHEWEEDAGVYLPASDPSIAVYPEGFRHPSGGPGTQQAVAPTPTATPSPQRGYAVTYDLEGDGSPENFLLYKEAAEGEYGEEAHIHLRIADASGKVLADGTVFVYNEWKGPDRRCMVYNLGNGRIFVHGQLRWDSVPDDYRFFRMEDGKLVQELYVRDSGMTDGCMIYNGDTGEEIFYSHDPGDVGSPEYLAALNRYMESYGYSFVLHGADAYIDLPASQLICTATQMQIDPDAPAPNDGVTFADFYPAAASDAGPSDSAGGSQPAPGAEVNAAEASPRGAYTTGDVNLRSGPGLGYDSLKVIPAGTHVEYLNEESVDERGVSWYRISCFGTSGWGSSKYVKLE